MAGFPNAMKRKPHETFELHINRGIKTPLGSVRMHGLKRDSDAYFRNRRLGCFCLVYTLGGTTLYEDEYIGKWRLKRGDLLLLFPGVLHSYGNGHLFGWDELFMVFDGPVFDLWRKLGLLDPKKPIIHLEPIDYWQRRLSACTEVKPDQGLAAGVKQLTDVQHFLAEVLEIRLEPPEHHEIPWLSRACLRLQSDLDQPVNWKEFSRSLGLSFETFRKQFTRATGTSPGRYRTMKIIDRACELSLRGRLSGKEIARELGFATKQHFSRRFREMTGLTLTDYRRQWKSAGEPKPLPK
jgi:AraC-like DNA-binding protein